LWFTDNNIHNFLTNIKINKFDKISQVFSSTVNQTKEFVRTPLFLKLIGDVRNKNVADFGCGDGFFTRILAQNFARKVMGVDYSEKMIKTAIEKEKVNPLKITYLLEDVRFLRMKEKFDLISAVYLLDYAESKEDLLKMALTAYHHLNPGGKFCAIVPHPHIQPTKDFEFERKITSLDNKDKFKDGDRLKCEIKKNDKQFEFIFYYWSKDTYNNILSKAGFKDITWVEPFISERGLKLFGPEYWQNFLKKPSTIGFIGHK